MKNRVLVIGENSYKSLFDNSGYVVAATVNQDLINVVSDVDLICFTGGTDVSPKLYGEESHYTTSNSDFLRDRLEEKIFKKAISLGIPMVGICRGAQLGCVLSGGMLVQNVTGHCKYHDMRTFDDRVIHVSSSHHQMMDPRTTDHILVGFSTDVSSSYQGCNKFGASYDYKLSREIVANKKKTIEPEVVFFPKTKFLAHQPHPEYMVKSAPYHQYFFETIFQFLGL